MTGEEQALAFCCAPPVARASRSLSSLAPESVDWRLLLERAIPLEVGALVACTVTERWESLLNGPTIAAYRATAYANMQRNVRLRADLQRVLQVLRRAGIPAVPFKGLALTQQAYGNVALRRVGDLDVMLHSDHVAPAVDALLGTGFRLQETPPGARRGWTRANLATDGWAAGEVTVELHQADAFDDYWRGTEATLWQWVRPDPTWGLAFSPELTIAHLALHWHQHRFGFRTLVDYAWAAEALAARVDAPALRALIAQLGLTPVVDLAEMASAAVFGTRRHAWSRWDARAALTRRALPAKAVMENLDDRDADLRYLLQAFTGPRTGRWLWRWLTLPTTRVRAHHHTPDAWSSWRVQAHRFVSGLGRLARW